MLRPIPGDPWGIEQHHWNTGAKENQQLNPGGPSNRQKKLRPKTDNLDRHKITDLLEFRQDQTNHFGVTCP